MKKGKAYNNNMFSWMHENLEIKNTNKYGLGIFANKNIKKNEVLFVTGGYVRDTKQDNDMDQMVVNYNMDIDENWSFCPISIKDLKKMPQVLINHSCNPNCGFKDQCFIVAIKNIKSGDEIVYDYAFVMFSNKKSKTHYKLKCLCGSKNCRKIITENDWKIIDLQKQYGKYFQPFLKEKFNKN
jgi:uncharacterized protein